MLPSAAPYLALQPSRQGWPICSGMVTGLLRSAGRFAPEHAAAQRFEGTLDGETLKLLTNTNLVDKGTGKCRQGVGD